MFAYCGNNPIKRKDITGKYNYTTYNYSYEYEDEYGIMGDYGTVFICAGNDIDDIHFFDKEENRPAGFRDGRDVIAWDVRDREENPDIIIYKSYNITDSHEQDAIISKLLAHEQASPSKWNRSASSMKAEWKWHNVFSPFDDSAKHVDFDNREEGKGGLYFIKKAWDASTVKRQVKSFMKCFFDGLARNNLIYK